MIPVKLERHVNRKWKFDLGYAYEIFIYLLLLLVALPWQTAHQFRTGSNVLGVVLIICWLPSFAFAMKDIVRKEISITSRIIYALWFIGGLIYLIAFKK
jgi:hypothetical protein